MDYSRPAMTFGDLTRRPGRVSADIERACLAQALAKTGGNLTQAAVLLGLSLRSIRYKVGKLNVPVP